MNWKISLFKIYWDKKDITAISDTIKRGTGWAVGPNVEKFEKEISKYIGVKYALVFNSGTSALHSLMLSYKIGPGDEVIVPSFTFIATANAVLFVGAKPIFAEIEEDVLGLNPKDIEKKITSKTKAIIAVHYGGSPCKIEEIKKIAKKYNLILIEDAAESLGAKFRDKKMGMFGDASILSFCQNKIITTGEGGAVVTNSKEIYEKLKLIRSHGRLETENYFSSTRHMDYVAIGYNFRLSDILSALGLSQLGKINIIINKRRKNVNYLNKKLSQIKEIITPIELKDNFSVYQMYTIRISNGKNTRDDLKKYLENKGIMTKIYFDPVHLTSFYKNEFGYKKGDMLITESIADQVLTLPMHPKLTKKEMDNIINNIESFFHKIYGKK